MEWNTSNKRLKRFKKLRVLNLYWVKSGYGFEDWFIIARSLYWARKYFNYFEGFDEDDSESAFIMNIRKNLIVKYNLKYFTGTWPSNNLLKDLGFKFISEISPRILNFNGKVYKEAYNTEVYTFEKLKKNLESI
ncbi:hypothetical protein [Chryseobacterium sp. SL1]|uniref:hypothetical protein n=1 Tax=Chryseobacterium sp. SL1 TaxID=2995159 RepID=UPI0022724C9C|nr:hypothetical protein [Chryseobacterium sp. SL1]MCY1662272.1 hypothetical protein [Chryseobacterium sp. SL1]